MTKKIILVDMDDTICHLVPRVVDIHNERYPTHPICISQVSGWDFDHIVHPDCNTDMMFKEEGLYENLEIFDEHMVSELKRIHDEYDVVIITAAFPDFVGEKWRWMQKHLPFIPYENFFSGKRKDLLKGDILIDDASHNLRPFVESGRPVIGITQNWNRDLAYDERINWANTWRGMKDRIDSIFRGLEGK